MDFSPVELDVYSSAAVCIRRRVDGDFELNFKIIISMGNSKHSTVISTTSLPEQRHPLQVHNIKGQRRRKSDPNDYADVHLGRLRSVDFRLGKVFIQSSDSSSGSSNNVRNDGLLLDKLWTPSTFVFTRLCEKNHQGFGFCCDISFKKESGELDGLYVVRQMARPRRGFQGMEDSPLDVFDVNQYFQRQVLGLVIKKLDSGSKTTVLEGLTVFSIQGVLGHVVVKEDWTNLYNIQNADGEMFLSCQRFNRISGGVEFQILLHTTTEKEEEKESVVMNSVCLATLVRLEESKFILKLYSPTAPVFKALMISFTLLLMYLMSR